jgi:CubicO group peptidase (beta-lactamase class C family)
MKINILKAINYSAKILDTWLPYKIKYEGIPGFSVGITYKGKLLYKAGMGYGNIKLKMKVTPNTCFRIASISKIFTSIAILQLVEKGKIKLDDPVQKYIPWFKTRGKKDDFKNITIEQLLSHTSGIFRDGNVPYWIPGKILTVNDLKDSISDNAIIFKNLKRFKYSNFGFALLGEVIRRVSGMDYKEYIRKYIIKKLNLKNTKPDLDKKIIKKMAIGYLESISNRKKKSIPLIETGVFAPAVGFISNVIDLAKFLSILSLNYRRKNSVLCRRLKEKMMKKYCKINLESSSCIKNGWYGLGIYIYEIKKRKIIGHSGGFMGFRSQISLDLKNDIGVIVLSNSSDSPTSSISDGIFKTIYHFIDNENIYNFNKIGRRLKQKLNRYEGLYHGPWHDRAIVEINNQLIVFDPKANSPVEQAMLLKPINKRQFIMEGKTNFDYVGEIAEFIFNRKKKETNLVLGGSFSLTKVKNKRY